MDDQALLNQIMKLKTTGVATFACDTPKGKVELLRVMPGLAAEEVLQDVVKMLSCMTELTRRAMARPDDVEVLMRSGYYLNGMAKALVEDLLLGLHGESGATAH
jgi:hypothetical protein